MRLRRRPWIRTVCGLFVCLAASAGAAKRPGEFAIAELEGRHGGPHAFLRQHAIRQAWPAPPEQLQQLEAVAQAGASFGKIKSTVISGTTQRRWRTVGPASLTDNGAWELWEPKNSSGRVTDLAVSPGCDEFECRLFVGSAGGGLWLTEQALKPDGPYWRQLSDGLLSNNIGCVALDPNDPTGLTVYVGTGETNFAYSSAAGRGVFRSIDGGESFARLDTQLAGLDFTATRGVSRVAVQPGEPNTIYVATTTAMLGMTSVRGGQSTSTGQEQPPVGLYRTIDGGNSWVLLFEAPISTRTSAGTPDGMYEEISGVKDVKLDPLDPETVYISVADDGLYRSSPSLDGDAQFHPVFRIVADGDNRADSYAAFDLTEHSGTTRIYLYNGNGIDHDFQALYRHDDARVPRASLYSDGSNQAGWRNMTTPLGSYPDYVDFSLCNGQCVYDLVVSVPEGRPNTVWLGGQLSRHLGDPAVRSNNGGRSFTSLAIDLQEPPGTPHVDVRAIVFSPENPDIAFIGSDGGVVRTNGLYGDGRYHCRETIGHEPDSFDDLLCNVAYAQVPEQFVFMNEGLQTMQLYNISADPAWPLARQMAGTQDNSTQWNGDTGGGADWTKLFNIGDGTSANGFHPTNPDILFASFQSNWFFTHFDGGRGGTGSWVVTSWPIRDSGEATDPVGPSGRQFMTFDPHDPDTQYTGFEHIWRTRNNGGERSFLEAYCTIDGNRIGPGCGDWEPLGENLAGTAFGTDRAGGVIVAAERSAADRGTLWAATSLGRVFVTRNADAAAGSVSFRRLDSATTPRRFISGIAVDHRNPDRAFISYSGFDALTPATPGHVFEVTVQGETAEFSRLDHNLGDMPVNHLVRDDSTGDLYAATDYGVLMLSPDASAWREAGEGLPEVLTPHLEIHPAERLLFAATHGMGGWYLPLEPLRRQACLQDPGPSLERSISPDCPVPPPGALRGAKERHGKVDRVQP